MTAGDHESTGGTWLVRLMNSDSVRRVVRTFLQAFLGLLLPGALGWLNALTEWARAEGQAPFPDAGSLAYLGVAAIGAGAIAVVSAIIVGVEDATGHALLRDVSSPAPRLDTGAVAVRTIAIEAVAVALVVLLVVLL